MHENRASHKEGPDFLQTGFPSLSIHIGYYPQSVFSTLVWLRREHEALALAELAEKPDDYALILCTIAKQLRKRGDGERQHILSILAQAQECLASLPEWGKKISHVLQQLVAELACWQQWLPAQELANAIKDSWDRERAFSSIFQQKLQTKSWEEALTLARYAGNGGHRWMFCSLCDALACAQQWELAEEVAGSIKHPGSKVEALCVLARELAATSHRERAETFWRQALQVAFEEGVSPHVFGELSENLARAQQWELAEFVANALVFPLPGAQVRAKQAGKILDQQSCDRIDIHWIPAVRAKALATLALETTKAQHWLRVDVLWKEARAVADSCESTWHHTTALGNLAICLAEANLWELALDTWRQAEAAWKRARALSRSKYEASNEQDRDNGCFEAYESEEEERRIRVLVPLCRHLVGAQRWKQAWKLFCNLEDRSPKIRLGREIAIELDRTQQHEAAQMVWKHISKLALVTPLWAHDLAKLALALQQAQYCTDANTIWKASVNSMLRADEDDFDSRTINCGSLALKLVRAQRCEEAELLLKESVRAATLLASAALTRVD